MRSAYTSNSNATGQINKARYNNNYSKQITRILVHLRDQIRRQYPQLSMPTQWMIRQLVDNASIERDGIVNLVKGKDKSQKNDVVSVNESDHNWREDIIELLTIIHRACDVGLDRTCTFVHTERMIPLFPNHELFDEWDTYRFSQALLHYLEKDFEITDNNDLKHGVFSQGNVEQ